MGKYDVRSADPVRYANIKEEQDKYKGLFGSATSLIICCPYCNKKISKLFKGTHSATQYKCEQCGEEFIFPPVSFYRQQSN